MTQEQRNALKEVRAIVDVIMCVDPSHDVTESISDLMRIAYQKINGILDEK